MQNFRKDAMMCLKLSQNGLKNSFTCKMDIFYDLGGFDTELTFLLKMASFPPYSLNV